MPSVLAGTAVLENSPGNLGQTKSIIKLPIGIAGGAVYDDPLGLLSSAVNKAIEGVSGKDIGGNVFAMFANGGHGVSEVQTAGVALSFQKSQAGPDFPPPILVKKPDLSGSRHADASSQGVPRLSPGAFHTLLNSINDAPTQAGRQGLAAGAEMPPVSKGTIRDAGLEINRKLRAHASK
jgi:hypothetical protein